MADVKRKPIPPMRGRGMPVPKGTIKKGTFKRLLKTIFKYYKWRVVLAFVCIFFNAIGALISSIFLQALIDDVITPGVAFGYDFVKEKLIGMILSMAGAYAIVVVASFLYNRVMATITQGVLYHLREEMFSKIYVVKYPSPISMELENNNEVVLKIESIYIIECFKDAVITVDCKDDESDDSDIIEEMIMNVNPNYIENKK